jgi:hypothetical protein
MHAARLLGLGGVAIALAVLAPTAALERGTTDDGRRYASGGIGRGERDELAQMRGDYSLRVATAARGSGAYLAAVEVTITDQAGTRVFRRELDGPLLLIDLPPGRYTVEAALGSQVRRAQTRIAASERREIYFYFDVAAEVLPKGETR